MEYTAFENLLRSHGLTVYQVSKATGIAASTFSDWKSGRSTPKADKLARIADFFAVSLDELLGTNEGKKSAEASYRALRAHKMVPVIGVIRAGAPIVTDETLLGREFADVNDIDEYFYLVVCGDSMKNCGIVEGTYVLFHKQQYAENGDIVACLVDGESATVKRFFKQNHRIVLQPENDAYKPITLSPEDFEIGRARILGVAIEAKTKF
ncbi:MAG: helix-turn-helix domain-containing protein [Clostridia bacterium]|nr:helix-turn-helix domain-containing protein [Clostridia bacterium]